MLKRVQSIICVSILFGVSFFSCKSVIEKSKFSENDFIELKESESSEFKVVLECDTLYFGGSEYDIKNNCILLEGHCSTNEYPSKAVIKSQYDCYYIYNLDTKKVVYHFKNKSLVYHYEEFRDSVYDFFYLNGTVIKYNRDLAKKEVYRLDFPEYKPERIQVLKNHFKNDNFFFQSLKKYDNFGVENDNIDSYAFNYLKKNKVLKIKEFDARSDWYLLQLKNKEFFITQLAEDALGDGRYRVPINYSQMLDKKDTEGSKSRLKKVKTKLDKISDTTYLLNEYYKLSFKSKSVFFKSVTNTDQISDYSKYIKENPSFNFNDSNYLLLINEEQTENSEFFIYDKLTNRLFSIKFK